VLRVLSADGLLASDRAQQQTFDLSLTSNLVLPAFDPLAYVGIGMNAVPRRNKLAVACG
jgi:hypothetical protein